MSWHTQTVLLAALWSILHQTRPANVLVDDNGVAAEQCRSSLIWRRLLPATAGPGSFRWNGAALIGTTILMMTRHGKYGKLWGCMGRFIRLGKSLASQVQETMQRRKERFLSAAAAAWQETNTCKYSRFESIESQVVFCASISVEIGQYHGVLTWIELAHWPVPLLLSKQRRRDNERTFGSLKIADKRF